MPKLNVDEKTLLHNKNIPALAIAALGIVFGIWGGHPVGTKFLFPSGHASIHQLFPFGWYVLLAYLAIILVNFQGSEIIGLAAAETRNPETTVPKDANKLPSLLSSTEYGRPPT